MMIDLLNDYEYRKTFLKNLNNDEAKARISGFYKWLQSEVEINAMIEDLITTGNAENILKKSNYNTPPYATTPQEIAAVGLFLMKECTNDEQEPWELSSKYGIHASYPNASIQDEFDEVMNRFIDPAIEYLEKKLKTKFSKGTNEHIISTQYDIQYPLEIIQSLEKFKQNYPDYHRNAFIMMQFGNTQAHISIVQAIRSTLDKYGINAFRADDKQYHDDLFPNVLTYIYGCRFGIAVFERLEEDDFNPNVSLEVGYMKALHKSVCLLKDRTLKTLNTDLIGKLYKTFDPQEPKDTIPPELEKWLSDKEIISI